MPAMSRERTMSNLTRTNAAARFRPFLRRTTRAPLRQAGLYATRRAKHCVNPCPRKYFTFPNFGFVAYPFHLGPAKGAFATVTRCGPGGGGRGSAGADGVVTGRATVSDPRDAVRPGAVTAGSSVARGEHTRAPAPRRDRPRTEKSCGPDARSLCVKSCGDACGPTGHAHQRSAGRRGQ
jgi:hypothetical protein